MVRIYTRGGDDGETGLLGNRRVLKSDPVIEAVGQLDELNAWLGLVVAAWEDDELTSILRQVQRDLFELGAELASPTPRAWLSPDRIAALEREIDRLWAELPPLRHFILPGGGRAGALCHVARTVARRAERAVVALARGTAAPEAASEDPAGPCEPDPGAVPRPNPLIVAYLNRLSDLLFVVARVLNHRAGRPEPHWTGDRPGEGSGD